MAHHLQQGVCGPPPGRVGLQVVRHCVAVGGECGDVCSSSPRSTTGGAQGVGFTRVFPLLAPVVTGRLHCIGAVANATAPRTVAQL
jgi:hypothetical protein